MKTKVYVVIQHTDDDNLWYVLSGDRAGPAGEWGPFESEERAEEWLESHRSDSAS